MKLSFLTILVIGISFNAFAQKNTTDKINIGVDFNRTNTYIVDYNFEKGKYEINNLKIKVGTPVSFRVSNINRLAYLIGVTSKDTVIAETNLSNFPFNADELSALIPKSRFNSSSINNTQNNPVETITDAEVSDAVKNLKKKGVIDVKSVTDSIESIKRDLGVIFKSTELTEKITTLQNRISFLKNETGWLKDSINNFIGKSKIIAFNLTTAADSLKKNLTDQKNIVDLNLNQLTTKSKESQKLLDDLSKEKKSFEDKITKTETLRNEALAKFKKDNDLFVAAFEKFKYCYFNAKKAVQFCSDIKAVANNPALSLESYLTKHKKNFDTIRSQLPYLKKEVEKFENLYADLEILYSDLKYNPSLGEVLNFGGQVKLYSHSNNLKAIADKMHAYVKQVDVHALSARAQETVDFLMSPEAYQVTFGPIQPINDAVVFDVKINKRPGNASELFNNLNFKHKEYTYGGTRIDFSLGLAGSYFNHTPVYELSTQKVTGSDVSIISIAKKSDKLSVPSLLGLATMSYRSTGYVAFGGSAGLGIDVMNGKIQLSNFYVGPSAIFGKYQRLTLTTGATIRNVGQLSSGYEVGTVVQGPADKITNFISDKYKVGFFLSLSVNLTKGIKDNIKQLKSSL